MKRLAFLLPGSLERLTGGTIFDRRIVAGLRATGWEAEVISLATGFPWPDAAELETAAAAVAALPDGTLVVADGLAFGAMPAIARQHAQRLRWVALVHHPLALETGLDAHQAQQLFESELQALACVRAVVVTSTATARALASDYGVPSRCIHIVEPGVAPAALSAGTPAGAKGQAVSLLCVASLTPRKGHVLLLDALAGLRDRAWSLHCVGSTTHDAATTAAVRAKIATLGLGKRVQLHGERDAAALEAAYARADAFVLASFHEGYGMALSEALAHGLPVLSTMSGAIPQTVPAGAGVLVPPGDPMALAAALARLFDDPAWRATLALGARAVRQRLPDWPVAVARFARVLDASSGAAP